MNGHRRRRGGTQQREGRNATHLELVDEDGDGVELIAGSRRISHDELPGGYLVGALRNGLLLIWIEGLLDCGGGKGAREMVKVGC